MSNESPKKPYQFHLTLFWRIDQFSTLCAAGRTARFVSDRFLNHNCDEWLSWHLVLTLHRDNPSNGAYFDLCCDSVADLRKCCPLSGTLRIRFYQPGTPRIIDNRVISLFHVTSVDENGLCGVRFRYSFFEVGRMAAEFQDKIEISCALEYTRQDFYTKPAGIDERIASLVESAECSLSRDLERFRIDEHFSDATISVKGKNYAVHKAILAARCSVFNAMFRNDMQESQKNHIIVTDIEQDVFEELLHYIYTGKITNLEESAFELFPVADKYDLKELKNACEGFLRVKLSAENAGKILVLADMHNAEDLKTHALRFVKENSTKFKDSEHAEMWNVLTESRPGLMKDMLAMFLKK